MFKVRTKDFKEALKMLEDSVKKNFASYLHLELQDNKLRLWSNDKRYHYLREIYVEVVENCSEDNLHLALDKEQLIKLKKSLRYYKDEYVTFKLKENENYIERLPRVLRHKLVVNDNEEIEIN